MMQLQICKLLLLFLTASNRMHTYFLQLVLGCLAIKIHFVGIAAWSIRLKFKATVLIKILFKFVLLEQSLWIVLFLEPVPNNLFRTAFESARHLVSHIYIDFQPQLWKI